MRLRGKLEGLSLLARGRLSSPDGNEGWIEAVKDHSFLKFSGA